MPRIPARVDPVGTAGATRVTSPTFTAFPREQSGDRQFQSAQRAAESATIGARALPFSDGNLIAGVALSTTSADISHRLGKPWSGYIVMRLNANAVVYESPTQTDATKTKLLSLTASASCTADIWVFG